MGHWRRLASLASRIDVNPNIGAERQKCRIAQGVSSNSGTCWKTEYSMRIQQDKHRKLDRKLMEETGQLQKRQQDRHQGVGTVAEEQDFQSPFAPMHSSHSVLRTPTAVSCHVESAQRLSERASVCNKDLLRADIFKRYRSPKSHQQDQDDLWVSVPKYACGPWAFILCLLLQELKYVVSNH